MSKPSLFDEILSSGILFFILNENEQIIDVADNIAKLSSKTKDFYIDEYIYDVLPGVPKGFSVLFKKPEIPKKLLVFNSKIQSKLGTSEPYNVNITRSKDNLIVCTLLPDYSDRQVSIHRQSEIIRTTLESLNDHVLVLDVEGALSEIYSENKNGKDPLVYDLTYKLKLDQLGWPEDVAKAILEKHFQAKEKRISRQHSFSLHAFGTVLYYHAKISPRYKINGDFAGTTILIKDISFQIKNEQKLKNSINYYLKILENFPNPVCRMNLCMGIDFVNQTWLRFTDSTQEKEFGNQWQRHIHEDDIVRVEKNLHVFGENKSSFYIEFRLMHHSGHYRWVMFFGEPFVGFDNQISGFIGSVIDIDGIKKTQRLLKESEIRYRTMVEEQTDLVCRWKADTTLTFANQAFCKVTGFEEFNLVGKKWLTLFVEERRAELIATLRSFVTKKEANAREVDMHDYKGNFITYQWLSNPIFDAFGNFIEYQSVGRDVTEKKEKDKEINNLLGQLNRKIKELSLFNKVSEYIHANLSVGELLQNMVQDLSNSFFVRGRVSISVSYGKFRYYNQGFENFTFSEKESFYFGKRQKGRIDLFLELSDPQSLQAKKAFITGSERNTLQMVCEILDSYLEKQIAEIKLRESELRYRELFNNVLDIVFSVDSKGVLLKTNRAAYELLGNKEVEGKNIFSFIYPEDVLRVKRKVVSYIKKQKNTFSLEVRILNPKGEILYAQINGFIKYTTQKQVIEIFGIARNITHQKQMEKNLLKAILQTEERERRRFAEELHDGIGPLLSGTKMYLQKESLVKNLNKDQKNVLLYSRELVDEAIEQTRTIANNLMPSVLNDFGLEKALVSFVAKINNIGSAYVELEYSEGIKNLGKDESLVAYRVINELINNALKHAECDRINVKINQIGNDFEIYYSDNGKGFDVIKYRQSKKKGGMGINNIFNRIESVNGKIFMDRNKGKGIYARIKIPL